MAYSDHNFPSINRNWIVFLGIIALSVIVRLPTVAFPQVDWDEGMYLTVAQDITRGYLPYARYWAIKPPLGFFFYAASIELFGNSIIALRLLGAIYIGIAAGVVYAAGRRFLSNGVCIVAAMGVIAISTRVMSGNAIMMEHVALLPLAWLAYQVCSNKASACQLGLAIGICTLIRINLLLLLPAGIWFYYRSQISDGHSLRLLLKSAMKVTFVAALPLACVIAVYWQAGLFHMLYMVNVTFSQIFLENNHLPEWRIHDTNYIFSLRNQLVMVSAAYAFWLYRSENNQRNRAFLMLLLFAGMVLVSMLITGDKYEHYNIQLLPFVVLPLTQLAKPREPWLGALCCLAVGVYTLTFNPVAKTLLNLVHTGNLPGMGSYYYEIADYLDSHKVAGQFVLSPQNPVINFMTDSLIPTSSTSPADYAYDSRLKRLYGDDYTLDNLAHDIFEKKPRFIVILPKIRQFTQMTPYINKYYVIRIGNPNYQIYEYDHQQ